MCADILSDRLPLFMPCPNAQLAMGEIGIGINRDKYIPRPSSLKDVHLQMYEFVGKLMGIAIRTHSPLSLDFPSFVWKPLADQPTTVDDLRDIDQFCGQCLEDLRTPEKNDLNAENFSSIIFENFTTTLSDGSKVALIEDGASVDVTFENRLQYVELVTEKRLAESRAQIQAILRGLSTIVPAGLLSLFTWKEVELAVCGKPEVDVEQLKRCTKYEGYKEDDPVVQMFWKVMEELTPGERCLFLRFVSGRERLPTEGELRKSGAKHALTISKVYSNTDSLPKSSTCYSTLSLPRYSSQEILKKQLLTAINYCSSIDSDFQVRD